MMNKRIKELAKQAAQSVNPGFRGSDWQREYEQKFAELIVGECEQICLERAARPQVNTLINDEAIFCALKIKEHFGVEE